MHALSSCKEKRENKTKEMEEGMNFFFCRSVNLEIITSSFFLDHTFFLLKKEKRKKKKPLNTYKLTTPIE
jgi:hypothetical protein